MSKFTAFVIVLVLAICIMFSGLIIVKNNMVAQETVKAEKEFNKTQEEAIPDSIDDNKTVKQAEEVTKTAQETADEVLSSIDDDKKELTVEYNDTAVLDYVGISEGKEFDGGTAADYELQIGSGSFIEGFEYQIEGHKIGDVFNVNVTFPEDYTDTELAGKDAIFVVTLKDIIKAE